MTITSRIHASTQVMTSVTSRRVAAYSSLLGIVIPSNTMKFSTTRLWALVWLISALRSVSHQQFVFHWALIRCRKILVLNSTWSKEMATILNSRDCLVKTSSGPGLDLETAGKTIRPITSFHQSYQPVSNGRLRGLFA